MTKWIGVLVGIASVVIAPGCGAATSATTDAREPSGGGDARVVGSGTAADPVQLCHMNGGMGRTDYAYVANYECPDGQVPLLRDPERGAGARRGNVGAGPDGHVVDLYDVPCASGPVELYVDAYHCGEDVDTEIDPENLTRRQLAGFAAMIRSLHEDPTSARAHELRRQMLMWTIETRQVSVVVCTDLALAFTPRAENTTHPYTPELMLSMAAAVIEDGRDPVDPVAVNVRALQGLMLYYVAVVRSEGEGARVPELDALLELERDGTLDARVRELLAGCDASGMGVHHTR